MNDAQLHRLLRDSPAQISLPGSFTREVWSRIETAAASPLRASLFQTWYIMLRSLSQPAPALATIALCMLIGGGLSWVKYASEARTRGELAYTESINPFLRSDREVSQ